MNKVSTISNSSYTKILGAATATLVALSLAGAPVVSASSISNTGPFSYNKIKHRSSSNYTKTNHNFVHVNNHNYQYAKSGSAYVKYNTFGGHATTGKAWNTAHNNVWLSIRN